jgi:hypothetical protein
MDQAKIINPRASVGLSRMSKIAGMRRKNMEWHGDRLKVGNRLSGYSVVPDQKYPQMWRVKCPDGRLSDMVNRTRAKDAAMAMFDRDLRQGSERSECPPPPSCSEPRASLSLAGGDARFLLRSGGKPL